MSEVASRQLATVHIVERTANPIVGIKEAKGNGNLLGEREREKEKKRERKREKRRQRLTLALGY